MSKTKKTLKETNSLISLVKIYLSAAIFAIPLVVTNGYYNITETKSVCFYILSILLTVAGCVYFFAEIIKKKRIKTDFNTVDVTVLVFGLFSFLSAVLSEYQSDVWSGGNSRYQGVITVFLYIAVYFVVSRNYSFSSGFLLCALLAFSLVSVTGALNCFDIDLLGFYGSIAQKYKEAYISTIGNVNFYSAYLCLLFPLVVCGFCQTVGKTSQIIYLVSLIIGSFGMMVTSSESFVVGFVLSMMIIPMFISDNSEKLKKFLQSIIIIVLSAQLYLLLYNSVDKKNIELSQLLTLVFNPFVSLIILLICGIVYLLITKRPQGIVLCKRVYMTLFALGLISVAVGFILSNTIGLGVLDKFFRITDNWGTYRGEIWKQCLEVYKDFSVKDKLFGIGPEALYRVVEASEVHGTRTLDQAHNEYLQYLLTVGLFGVLSYLSVIAAVTVSVIRRLKANTLAVGLMAGLISYWVQASVNIAQPFTTPIMYIFIACIGGMLYNERQEKTEAG